MRLRGIAGIKQEISGSGGKDWQHAEREHRDGDAASRARSRASYHGDTRIGSRTIPSTFSGIATPRSR
jgi:hypothetical protein